MPRPRVVVFDLGKVLVDFDYQIALRRLAPLTQLALSELNQLVNQSPLLLRYESGQMTSVQFFEGFRSVSGFRGDFAEFGPVFGDIFTAIEPMVALHEELRARGVRTVVFSNTNELAARHIRDHFPFFRGFDGYILSFEHGVMKPDPRLYEVVERTAGCRGPELLYIDDRPENVAAGEARGWQGIIHAEPQATRQRVCATGLLDC
jgi:glucose-1-phosphatase